MKLLGKFEVPLNFIDEFFPAQAPFREDTAHFVQFQKVKRTRRDFNLFVHEKFSPIERFFRSPQFLQAGRLSTSTARADFCERLNLRP